MTHVQISRDPNNPAVGVITLDDPSRRNALSIELCTELVEAMQALETDGETGAVVVTGKPPAFCAGADLTQLGDSRKEGLLTIYEGFLAVARSPLPTVAAVNGPAVGAGMNLALACDIRLVGPKARFDCRFLDLGIHPGGGHTWMMRRIVGPQTAAAMVLFGEVLKSDSAVEHGLAWKAYESDKELMSASLAVAGRAAGAPTELAQAVKATLREVHDVDDHSSAVELELVKQLHSMDQPAFAEKLAELQKRIASTS